MARPVAHEQEEADEQDEAERLRRRALRLEWATNGWNTMEVFVTIGLGVAAGSLALIAFGLDSLVEVFASAVVIWHLRDPSADPYDERTHRALRLIAGAFWVLALYLLGASIRSLVAHNLPDHSPVGAAFLAVTAVVMFGLAHLKRGTAEAMSSEPLETEASMTFLDGCLSVGIVAALVANILAGWWWADAAAAIAVAVFALREGIETWRDSKPHPR